MTARINRRETITLVGGAAAWPLAARAQQPVLPVIGFLGDGSLETRRDYLAAFLKGLAEMGYVEGRNVTIGYRWAEDRAFRAIGSDPVLRRHHFGHFSKSLGNSNLRLCFRFPPSTVQDLPSSSQRDPLVFALDQLNNALKCPLGMRPGNFP